MAILVHLTLFWVSTCVQNQFWLSLSSWGENAINPERKDEIRAILSLATRYPESCKVMKLYS